jgi:hypothetical protein
VITLYTLHTLERAKSLHICSSSSSSSKHSAAKALKGATQDSSSSISDKVEHHEAVGETMLRLFKLPHEALFRKIVGYL